MKSSYFPEKPSITSKPNKDEQANIKGRELRKEPEKKNPSKKWRKNKKLILK